MILVTGGSGFIGRRLVPRLTAAGQRVRLLRRAAGTAGPTPDVEIAPGDLTDSPSLARALDGVTAVVHLAGQLPSPAVDEARLRAVNVDGTRALAGAARAVGVARFIHLSSAGVYGRQPPTAPIREDADLHPATPYERTKAAAESALTEAWCGTPVEMVILRPAGVFGPGREETRRFFRQVLRRKIWLHGPADHAVHPTFVEDVVQAVERALALPAAPETPLVVNVAGDRGLSLREFVTLVAERADHRLWQVRVPLPHSLRPRGHYRILDLSRSRSLLGFVPTPLEAAVDATLDWVREGPGA